MRRFWLSWAVIFCCAGVAGAESIRDHDIVPEDYFDIASIFACVVSPDGTHAAYVESRWGEGEEGRKNDLWVVNLAGRGKLRLTFDGFGPGHVTWSADGRWIYFRGSDPHPQGDDQKPPYDGSSQVWRIAPAGGDAFPVTRVEDGIRHFELSSDGQTLYYTTSEEVYEEQWKDLRKEFSDLEYGHGVSDQHAIWKLDLTSWRTSQIREANNVIHEMALAPDGKRVALITTTDNELIFKEGWSTVEVLDLASGEAEVLTPEGWRRDHPSPFAWLDNLAWSGDGLGLAFTASFDGYPAAILLIEWSGGEPHLRELDRPHPVDFSGGLMWRGPSRTLCYRGEDRGRVRAFAIAEVSKGGQGETRALTPGEVVVGSFSFSQSGAQMAAVIGTPTHLGDIFRVADGSLDRVTNLNPQVDTWKLPAISTFSWTGADGDTVEGILELPPGYTPGDPALPLIVELHGGPTSATHIGLRLWIYGRALMAAKGFALLSPNYHGSTGFGDEFMTKLIGRENEIEVEDIRTGVEALIAKGIADRKRLGVMGWSNGGYLTNAMITAAPNMFKAASSGAGVLDMVIQWAVEDTPGHVVNYMEGLPWEQPEAYRKGSPLYGLGKVKTPTLIHVGGNDPRVPPAHSRGLYRALRHYLDIPVELIVYPGEGHGLSTHDNRLAKMKWDLAWFEQYLMSEEE